VPFYIRTGKRLAARDAHIVVNFRPAPHAIFRTPLGAANRLVITLQPRDGLQLHLLAQGQENRRHSQSLTPVHLDLDFDKRFGSERVGAYERLLLDVIDGRLNLFVRSDEQEAAWRWVEPLLDAWEGNDTTAAVRGRQLGAERGLGHDRARRLLLERGSLAAGRPCGRLRSGPLPPRGRPRGCRRWTAAPAAPRGSARWHAGSAG
jgi:hypothetical protein